MAITKDIDSQPLTEAFSFTREKLKAIHGLRGILIGLVADKRLNEKEFLFLDVWLKSQQYLAEDPDVVNILRQVGDILEAGQISAEALAGMQEHIEQFISSKDTGDSDPVGRIDELVGFWRAWPPTAYSMTWKFPPCRHGLRVTPRSRTGGPPT